MSARGDRPVSIGEVPDLVLLACTTVSLISTVGWVFFWTSESIKSALPLLGLLALALGAGAIVGASRRRAWRAIVALVALVLGQWWFLEPLVLAAIWSVFGFV